MSLSPEPTPPCQNSPSDVGELGEHLVAKWLEAQGWVILHHRWRCRWGEIDLIAGSGVGMGRGGDGERGGEGENLGINVDIKGQLNPLGLCSPILAFVEVKTRSRGNWDAEGRLAITPSKQAKLWQTAELFLAEYPDLANLPCRFDVGLVSYRRLPRAVVDYTIPVPPVEMSQPIVVAGYEFILHEYIESAFG